MNQDQLLNVHIGEVKTGTSGQTLKTILGSCVGIAFIWKAKSIYGLAHCLLPEPMGVGKTHSPGRFVDHAIPELLKMMNIKPDDYHEIEAVLAGGGNMTSPKTSSPDQLVGVANITTARKMLKNLGIRIIHEDVGGEEGRKLTVCCSSGNYTVEIIPRLIAV